VDILEVFGTDRIWMNSACDWGVSVPLAVPYAALEMRRRGHAPSLIDQVIYQNPIQFMSQSPKFKPPEI
jgi:predicted metal-dependent TIM-barrel fold hydrolase